MAIKTAIQAQVDTIDTGGVNTAAEVRAVFATNAASLLENIYADIITESHSSNTIYVPETAGFEYEVEISKIGRRVTLHINAVNTTVSFLGGIVFKTLNTEYLSYESQVVNYQLYDNNGVSVKLKLLATATQTSFSIQAIPNGSFKGTISYNVKN